MSPINFYLALKIRNFNNRPNKNSAFFELISARWRINLAIEIWVSAGKFFSAPVPIRLVDASNASQSMVRFVQLDSIVGLSITHCKFSNKLCSGGTFSSSSSFRFFLKPGSTLIENPLVVDFSGSRTCSFGSLKNWIFNEKFKMFLSYLNGICPTFRFPFNLRTPCAAS